MTFFPATSTYPSILGDLYSAALNAPVFDWEASPAMTELEIIAMDWLAKLLHLPSCYYSLSEGGGAIYGSASEAIATVMVAARDRYLTETTSHLSGAEKEIVLSHRRSRLVAIGSAMCHSSTQKAAMIAGTKYRSVPVKSKDCFSMTGDGLGHMLEQCQQEGLEPFFLTVTLGTTTTCAVDRFDEVASILKAHPKIWTHVDATYAGAALVCEEYQYLTKYLSSFHSFNVNMHKWLLVSVPAGYVIPSSTPDNRTIYRGTTELYS